jgi:hypothetical protein
VRRHFELVRAYQQIRTPRLWPLQLLVPLAILLAVAAAVGAYCLVLGWILGQPMRPSGANLEQQKMHVEVAKAALGVTAAAGAAAAIVVTYRRARLEHAQSLRDDARLFTERFENAADQLGHEKPAVRLAGVYALGQLADQWAEQRQTCADVLCAYLRMPYNPPSAPDGEREVRWTILRVICAHLLDPAAHDSWCHLDFDFSGVAFDGGGLPHAQFLGKRTYFAGASFSKGHVDFSNVIFGGAVVDFTGAKFTDACAVNLGGATFSSQHLSLVGVLFHGEVNLRDAKFSVGSPVDLTGADFSRRSKEVIFSGAMQAP